MCLSPALTISVKKWRCCLPAAEPTWLKGIRVQGSRGHLRAAVKERVRLWGLFLSSNPHCSPPRGLLQVPGYKSCWRQDRSPAFLCFPQEEKKFKIRGARRGSKKMCVCACVCVFIYVYAYTNIHTYTDTHVYTQTHTHTHKMTPVLSGWDHPWERETYPLFHGSLQRVYRCVVFFF